MGKKKVEEIIIRDRTMMLIWVSAASCLLSQQSGYNMWLLYSPTVILQELYNVTAFEEMKDAASHMTLVTISKAVFPFGGVVGSLPVGCLSDRFGRKGTLFLTNILSLISAVLLAISHMIRNLVYTIVTRFYAGICAGIIFCVVPLYLGEISPTGLRGGITVMPHLFFALGILFADALSFKHLLGTRKGFPIMSSLSVVMPLLQLFLLPFLPESPRYLFIQRKNEERARKVLKKLRDKDDVEHEIEDLQLEDISEVEEKKMNPLKLLSIQSLRRHVITIVVVTGGEQLNGINAAYYYTEKLYWSTGLKPEIVQLGVIGLALIYCCTTTLAMFIADSKGHRFLLLTGFGVCSIAIVLLTVTLELQESIHQIAYLSLLLDNVFRFGQSFGPAPLVGTMVVKLFLQSSRASAFVVAGFVHWISAFISGLAFLYLEPYIGSYVFLIFWPISVATFIYILWHVPEIQNKTFVDVRRLMAISVAKKIQVKEDN